MTQGLTLPISLRHALCAAWQFTDAFTGRTITTPIDVSIPVIAPPYPSMPTLPWTALDGGDGTYRFLVTNKTVAPVGTFAVSVVVPSLEYVANAAYEPINLTLPRPLAGAYPQRSDFLINQPLWPTRVFTVPPGETAVVGTTTSAASGPLAGVKVTMWSSAYATPPSTTPHTYTDANGDFLFRLLGPDFRPTIGGAGPVTSVGVSIALLAPPGFTTPITPTTAFPQTIPLGQVTTMPIRVP